MAKVDRRLFGFLKDRKIFTDGGRRTLREALTAQEKRQEYKDRARRPIKKAKHK